MDGEKLQNERDDLLERQVVLEQARAQWLQLSEQERDDGIRSYYGYTLTADAWTRRFKIDLKLAHNVFPELIVEETCPNCGTSLARRYAKRQREEKGTAQIKPATCSNCGHAAIDTCKCPTCLARRVEDANRVRQQAFPMEPSEVNIARLTPEARVFLLALIRMISGLRGAHDTVYVKSQGIRVPQSTPPWICLASRPGQYCPTKALDCEGLRLLVDEGVVGMPSIALQGKASLPLLLQAEEEVAMVRQRKVDLLRARWQIRASDLSAVASELVESLKGLPAEAMERIFALHKKYAVALCSNIIGQAKGGYAAPPAAVRVLETIVDEMPLSQALAITAGAVNFVLWIHKEHGTMTYREAYRRLPQTLRTFAQNVSSGERKVPPFANSDRSALSDVLARLPFLSDNVIRKREPGLWLQDATA